MYYLLYVPWIVRVCYDILIELVRQVGCSVISGALARTYDAELRTLGLLEISLIPSVLARLCVFKGPNPPGNSIFSVINVIKLG